MLRCDHAVTTRANYCGHYEKTKTTQLRPAFTVSKRERCHANICASSGRLLPARHQGRLRDSTNSQNPAPEETRSPVRCGRRSCTSRPLFPSAEYPRAAPGWFQRGTVCDTLGRWWRREKAAIARAAEMRCKE